MPPEPVPDLSVVVPAFRNRDTVAELADRLDDALGPTGQHFELLFVVDGCPERTEERLRDLAGNRPRLRVLSLARNVGQNRAALTGLYHARGRVCVVMDADLQDAPEAVPALVAACHPPYAAAFARRRGRSHAGVRQWTSLLFKTLLWLLSRGRIPRAAGLFAAIGPDLRRHLIRCTESDPYVLAQIARSGLRTTSITVERRPNAQGRTAYTPGMRLALAARGLRQMLWPQPAPTNNGDGTARPIWLGEVAWEHPGRPSTDVELWNVPTRRARR